MNHAGVRKDVEKWEALKQLAEACGEAWWNEYQHPISMITDKWPSDAKFIAAASPETILTLLSTLSATQRELEAARATIEYQKGRYSDYRDETRNQYERYELELSTTQRERDELKVAMEVLRRKIHLVERHNQFFERCESLYCNPQGTTTYGPADAAERAWLAIPPGDPAKTKRIEELEALVATLKARESAEDAYRRGFDKGVLAEDGDTCVYIAPTVCEATL